METDLSQCLIARAGEVLACSDCGIDLAILQADLSFAGSRVEPLLVNGARFIDDYRLYCRCGGGPAPSPSGVDLFVDAERPRIYLSTGWRELGGEAA